MTDRGPPLPMSRACLLVPRRNEGWASSAGSLLGISGPTAVVAARHLWFSSREGLSYTPQYCEALRRPGDFGNGSLYGGLLRVPSAPHPRPWGSRRP
jgi:hypothetical protein